MFFCERNVEVDECVVGNVFFAALAAPRFAQQVFFFVTAGEVIAVYKHAAGRETVIDAFEEPALFLRQKVVQRFKRDDGVERTGERHGKVAAAQQREVLIPMLFHEDVEHIGRKVNAGDGNIRAQIVERVELQSCAAAEV